MLCTLFERPVREDVTFRLRENSHKKTHDRTSSNTHFGQTGLEDSDALEPKTVRLFVK